MALTEASLYSSLPKFVKEKAAELGTKVAENPDNKYVNVFMQRHVKNELLRKEKANLPNEHSTQMLDAVKLRKPRKSEKRKTHKKQLIMPHSERKRLKAFDIDPQYQKYEMYETLHDMWKDYICDLIDFTRFDPGATFCRLKLMKADYHGAIIRVVRSKAPSLVGAEGIVLQEMKNVFRIITKDDRVKTIPKRKTVFAMDIEGYRITLYGDSIMQRTGERSHKKFKVTESRMSMDL